jgi:hypothetical protein
MGLSELINLVILPILAGLVGGYLAEGVRTMLALRFLPNRIVLGRIAHVRRTGPGEEYWFVPVKVNATSWWSLLIAAIDNVRAKVAFVERRDTSTSTKRTYPGGWLALDLDNSSVTLRPGHTEELRVVTSFNGLRPVERLLDEVLPRDCDLVVGLKAGSMVIGYWLYSGAIVDGNVKEVEPIQRSLLWPD